MLSVKSISVGGSGGGGDTSLWAEKWYPERGVTKDDNLFYKAYQPNVDLIINTNVKISTNTVIAEVINTESLVKANPFYKAVNGYSAVT